MFTRESGLIRNIFVFSIIAILLLTPNFHSFSQSVKGQVVDEKGEGIPYASVFVKELSMGVASNEDGKFNIKVSPGTYSLLFQSLGYSAESRIVKENDLDKDLQVVLKTRYYNLAAVKISSKSEDPAYSVMRKVIGLAPYHQKQVKSYGAQVYMKGKVNVLKLSRMVKRMIRKEEDAPKEGEVYVYESNSDLMFKAPNSYEQKVLSLRNTFPGSDNNDPMDFIALNLYNPTYEMLISPVAPNAFTHYRFKYLGSSIESERLIHKIEVIPRRKNQQLLAGTIHIVDNLYCFHSVDLNGEFMAGKFHFNSQFAELNRDLWMPVSHSIDLDLNIMGNSAEVNYLASVTYNSVLPNDAMASTFAEIKVEEPKAPVKPKTPKQEKQQKKIEAIMQKDEITTRDMYQLSKLMEEQNQEPDTVKSLEIQRRNRVEVDSLAATRDSTYWEQLRPIPLKEDELKSFQKKDSLIRLAGPDSLRKKSDSDRFPHESFAEAAFSGGYYSPKNKTWSFTSEGISPNSFIYNTVDGLKPTYSFTVGKRFGDKSFGLNQAYSYAISRKEFMYFVKLSTQYSPMRRGIFSLEFGSESKDFNSRNGINTLVNSVSTLFFRENFVRLYHEQWLQLSNDIDIANGLVLRTNAKIFNRDSLENTTNYSFFYRNDKEFKPNIPFNQHFAQSIKRISFGGILNLSVNYTPEYYYMMHGTTKRMVRSRFPTYSISYSLFDYFSEKGMIAHRVQLGFFQNKDLGLFRNLYYSFNFGTYINGGNLHFADQKHFNTQPLYLVIDDNPSSFCNLPFYEYSTNAQWAEFHASYKSAFLALKFLPVFSKMFWKEALYLSALATPQNPYYAEVGYGLAEILQIISISGHVGYLHDGSFTYGFKIGIEGNVIGI